MEKMMDPRKPVALLPAHVELPPPPAGLEDFWKSYDLTEQDGLLAVLKIVFDLSGMIDETKVRMKIRAAALEIGWSRERLDEIEKWAANSSNWSSNGYVKDLLESQGRQVFKVKSWAY